MQTLYLDCFSGISGNMLLGAFIDAGLPEDRLRSELAKLSVSGYEITVQPVEKCGIHATYVDVKLTSRQRHRHLPDIFRILDESALDETVRVNSKAVFQRLAEAEAKVHGTSVEKIHFHEVGAVDAIVDVVGTVFAIHYLGIKKIIVSRLQTGTGFTKCSHGWMPVPAPATSELLRGIPYSQGEINRELVTPTGAAIIASLATSFGEIPAGFISKSTGYGAGTWDLDIPNVLRMQIGEIPLEADTKGLEQTLTLEANIDDLNPQVYEYVMEKLFAAGALDVWLTPIIMKKSRPAVTLSVLFKASLQAEITKIVFAETSTIGVRSYPVDRMVADREIIMIDTLWGQTRVKVSRVEGRICTVSPEYEDCRKIAEEHRIPLKLVQQEVLKMSAKLWPASLTSKN